MSDKKACDLLVVGGGGAGLTAAARAAYRGKKVILLEKREKTGGGAQYASAIRTFRSAWQRERGLPDVMDEFIRTGMDSTYWRLDPQLIRSVCTGTGKFFDWFCEMAPEKVGDFEVGTYVFDGPEGPKVPLLKGSRSHYGAGKVFMETMRDVCRKYGAELLTGWRADELLCENGRISGVLAETPAGRAEIRCSACLIAAGSWVSDPEIVRAVMPEFLEVELAPSCYLHCAPYYTGDGLKMAERAGVRIDRDNLCLRLMGPVVLTPSMVLNSMGNSGYQICVNLDGERWGAEPIQRRMGLFRAGHALVRQPKGIAWSLFDMNNLRAAYARSRQAENGYGGFFGKLTFPDSLEKTLADMDVVLSGPAGLAFAADSPEELAGRIGLPADRLTRTIADYNRACQDGNDPFFKDASEMTPLSEGPFFAVKGLTGSDGAFGGIPVDRYMRAYRQDGSVFEGLYAAGDLAGGRHLNLGGFKEQVLNDCSWALAGGFLAADHFCRSR